jgi:hypothetical protein
MPLFLEALLLSILFASSTQLVFLILYIARRLPTRKVDDMLALILPIWRLGNDMDASPDFFMLVVIIGKVRIDIRIGLRAMDAGARGRKGRRVNDVGVHDGAEVPARMVELEEVLLGVLGAHNLVERYELLA